MICSGNWPTFSFSLQGSWAIELPVIGASGSMENLTEGIVGIGAQFPSWNLGLMWIMACAWRLFYAYQCES